MPTQLNLADLDEFKQYLEDNNIRHRAGKGEYQVIQLETQAGWAVISKKKSSAYSSTPSALGQQLIKAFYMSKSQSMTTCYKYLARYSDGTLDNTPYARNAEEAARLAVVGGYCSSLADVEIIQMLRYTKLSVDSSNFVN